MSGALPIPDGECVLWSLDAFRLRNGENRVVLGAGNGSGFPVAQPCVLRRVRWTGEIVLGTALQNSTQAWFHKNGNTAAHRFWSLSVNLNTTSGWFTRQAETPRVAFNLGDELMIRVFIANAVEESTVWHYAIDILGVYL